MRRSGSVPRTSMSTIPALDFWRCWRGASCGAITRTARPRWRGHEPGLAARREEARAHRVIGAVRGKYEAVSALLSSRAMASICASESASAFSTTPVGFPVKVHG